MPYKQINQDRGFRAVSVLALGLKILINRASVDPGRELNGRSQQSHLFGDVDVAGPGGPSSRASAFWAYFRGLSEGLEGLAAGNYANTKERTPIPLFEHVFLARQGASTQQVEELTTQMTGVVEQLGGKVVKMENWGVRSLTYRMNKNRKAHFVLLNIDAPSAAVTEIERQERISEDVIRYLTVRVEEHEEGPSALIRKADRDRDPDDRAGGVRGHRHAGFRADPDRGGHPTH